MNFHFIRYLWNSLCVLYPLAFYGIYETSCVFLYPRAFGKGI